MKGRRARPGSWIGLTAKAAGMMLLLFSAPGMEGGTLTGTVTARGPAIDVAKDGGGAYQSRRFRFAERVDYSELGNFVVYIEGPVAAPPDPSEDDMEARVVQRDAMFQPSVLPVMVGTVVEWPNKDDIYHNVFSLSEAKEFDLGFYKDEDGARRVVFDKPGRIDVFCAIHTQMHCVILVLENPFFTRVDQEETFILPNVPAGTYQVRAWHERVPSQTREVVVPEEGEVEVNFTLGFGGAETE